MRPDWWGNTLQLWSPKSVHTSWPWMKMFRAFPLAALLGTRARGGSADMARVTGLFVQVPQACRHHPQQYRPETQLPGCPHIERLPSPKIRGVRSAMDRVDTMAEVPVSALHLTAEVPSRPFVCIPLSNRRWCGHRPIVLRRLALLPQSHRFFVSGHEHP